MLATAIPAPLYAHHHHLLQSRLHHHHQQPPPTTHHQNHTTLRHQLIQHIDHRRGVRPFLHLLHFMYTLHWNQAWCSKTSPIHTTISTLRKLLLALFLFLFIRASFVSCCPCSSKSCTLVGEINYVYVVRKNWKISVLTIKFSVKEEFPCLWPRKIKAIFWSWLSCL